MAVVTYRRYTIEDTFESKQFYNRVLNETPQNYITYTGLFAGGVGTLDHGHYTFNPINQTFTLKDVPGLIRVNSASRTHGVWMETNPYYCKIETLSIDDTTGFQMTSGKEYIREITLLDEDVSAEEGTYPVNGAHTDGYWYRMDRPFDFEMRQIIYEHKDWSPLQRYIMSWSGGYYYFDGVYTGYDVNDQLEFSYRLNPEDPFTVDQIKSAGTSYYSIDVSNTINYIEFRIRFYNDEKGYSNPFYVPLDAFGALFPIVKTKVNGVERKVVQAHVKINGVLKPITKIYTKVRGQLKEL